MSLKLINLNPCLKKLQDEGYELEIRDGFLMVHSVPYVNSNKEVLKGTLITNLVLVSPMLLVNLIHTKCISMENIPATLMEEY